jgi:hypothetical protein
LKIEIDDREAWGYLAIMCLTPPIAVAIVVGLVVLVH